VRFITDEEARRLGAPDDPEQRREVLRDAEALYDLVAAQPWIDEAAVRVLSERRDLSPERTTAALRFLVSSGRLVDVQPSAVAPPAGLPPLPPRLDDLNKGDLQTLARIYGIEGTASLNKPELITALDSWQPPPPDPAPVVIQSNPPLPVDTPTPIGA